MHLAVNGSAYFWNFVIDILIMQISREEYVSEQNKCYLPSGVHPYKREEREEDAPFLS